MKWPALILLALGLAAVVVLLRISNTGEVVRTIGSVGWGILLVILVHTPQTLAATIGWRDVILDPARPHLGRLFKYRWIKESVNALLPVAQVGGDVVRARLLIRSGVSLRAAAASCTIDVAAGTLSLFAYLLLGLGFFLLAPHDQKFAETAERAVAMAGVVAVVLMLAPRLGLFRLIEAALRRFTEGGTWSGLGELEGLHAAVMALYRDVGRLSSCIIFHLAAWGLGTVETYVALMVMGLHPTWPEAFVIDSLGQGVRAAGFAVPGALGVQEGGYIVVCALFGLPPEKALALSMIRRIREVALGVPGLIWWARTERRGWLLGKTT